ncbi:MAG: tetratricopeptide repeat protein [Calothrix sp. MO_192.B10]|nr:tetratricopeptide repeat protein [Calothrix sp. MO_192.B10]
MSVNDTSHTDNSVWNRQTYHRLKLALSLGLRRQIFIAVCDNLSLRNQVAAHLHSTLAYPVGQVLHHSTDEQEASTPAYPRIVTLRLNLTDPNPIIQINQWLTKYPPPIVGASPDSPGKPLPIPAFQIVGVEQLTRQPVAVQRQFLQYLRFTEQYWSNPELSRSLESNLLLWVPRPWLYAIKQSAPQFWQYRTGVFVFAGEPTPTNKIQGTSESFSNSRSVDFNHLERSLLPESSQKSELDLSQKSPVKRGHQPQEESPADEYPATEEPVQLEIQLPQQPSGDENNITSPIAPLNWSHINQELSELVLSTINTLNPQTTEQDQQPWQIVEEIEALHTQKASPEKLAAAYQTLGNLYRIQIEQGNTTLENLMVAIMSYQEAITYDENSPQVPDILNDLGTLYWMLHRIPPNSDSGKSYIEQGIEFYHLALQLISPETHVDTYARIQTNLGTAYGDLARFADPGENWQQAVSAYNQALLYRTEEVEPSKYASCQNNLGTAYWHLAQYDNPIANLQNAIASYNIALGYYSAESEPLKYGMIENNIGTAHWNLAQYDTPRENLQLAIDAYQEALKYRTPANLPVGCATTQNNLGTAYWHLANLDGTTKAEKQNLLKNSIEAYDEALALGYSLTDATLSFDLFATHNNLGLAHYQLATENLLGDGKDTISQHLETALTNHLQALNGFREHPETYQATLTYIIKTIRAFHELLGIQGQNLALSKIPGSLLSEIMPKI